MEPLLSSVAHLSLQDDNTTSKKLTRSASPPASSGTREVVEAVSIPMAKASLTVATVPCSSTQDSPSPSSQPPSLLAEHRSSSNETTATTNSSSGNASSSKSSPKPFEPYSYESGYSFSPESYPPPMIHQHLEPYLTPVSPSFAHIQPAAYVSEYFPSPTGYQPRAMFYHPSSSTSNSHQSPSPPLSAITTSAHTTRPVPIINTAPFVPTLTPSGWTPDHAKAIASSCHRPEFGSPAHWIIEQLEAGLVIHRLGRCKYFDVVKGFGFILDDNIAELGGRDVFVHFTGISMKAGFRCLSPGEKVEFDLVRAAGGGYQALNVTGAFGRPLIGLTAAQYAHHARGELASDRKRNGQQETPFPPPRFADPPTPPSHQQQSPPYQQQSLLYQQHSPPYHQQQQHHHQQQPPPQQYQPSPHQYEQQQQQQQQQQRRGSMTTMWGGSTKHRNVLPYFAFSERSRPAVESVGARCADYAPLYAQQQSQQQPTAEQSEQNQEQAEAASDQGVGPSEAITA